MPKLTPRMVPPANSTHAKPSAARLRGLKLIEPLEQGEYDGLCGLYSAVNACRLALAPDRLLTHAETWTLFNEGYAFLAERLELTYAVQGSITERSWAKLVVLIARQASELTGVKLKVQKLCLTEGSQCGLFDQIEDAIVCGEPVLAFLRGDYRHYTVISGYARRSFALFDSYGFRRVMRDSFVQRGATTASRHSFHVPSLLSIALSSS